MSSTILVVDDEPSIRRVVAAQLQRHGHTVIGAEDGEVAKVVLSSRDDVEAVITDLKMPRCDGLGLLAWMRGERPEIPVIVITAHGSVETAVDALKQGAYDYVQKPFDQDDLHAILADALESGGTEVAAEPVEAGAEGLKEYVRRHTERLERHRIKLALADEDGNVTRAAKALGISRRSLQTKMKDYGLRER